VQTELKTDISFKSYNNLNKLFYFLVSVTLEPQAAGTC